MRWRVAAVSEAAVLWWLQVRSGSAGCGQDDADEDAGECEQLQCHWWPLCSCRVAAVGRVSGTLRLLLKQPREMQST